MVPARLLCAQIDRGVMSVDGTVRTAASREALIEAVRAGERVKYLHFWGHRPLPDGRVGASCLSQWWPSPFTVDGVEYATAEHWMMAAKARLFGDAEGERRVLAAGTPRRRRRPGAWSGASTRRSGGGSGSGSWWRAAGTSSQLTVSCGLSCWARATASWSRRAP